MGCASPSARLERSPTQRIELLTLRRNPEAGLDDTPDDQRLHGVSYLHLLEGSEVALDVGLRAGSFARAGERDSGYFETHAGARWWFLGVDGPVQPYFGVGLFWNARGSSSRRFDYKYDDDGDNGLGWLLAHSSPYASLGVDFVLGAVSVGGGVRAVCGDGVDLSAAHPDDFALDVYVTAGCGF